MTLETILTALASSGFLTLVFAIFGKWYLTRLTNSIRHEYDSKLAKLESDLRLKENEVNALRETVLTTAMNGHRFIEERKVRALDDLWSGFMEVQKWALAVHMISPINLDGLSKNLHDEKTKQFVSAIIKPLNIDPKNLDIQKSITGRSARPWIRNNIWNVYKCYNSVATQAVLYLHAFDNGYDPREFVKENVFYDDLKKALPEISVDWKETTNALWPMILEVLEAKLLVEIQKEISGVNADDKALERISRMLKQIEQMHKDEKIKNKA